MHMRLAPFSAILLLALCTQGRAGESALDGNYISIQAAAAGKNAARVKSTASRVRTVNGKRSNVVLEETLPSNIKRNETLPSNLVDQQSLRNNVAPVETMRGNVIRLEQSAPKSLIPPLDKAILDASTPAPVKAVP